MIIFSLFDATRVMLKPWHTAGHTCFAFDLQHEGISKKGDVTCVGGDIRSVDFDSLPVPDYVFAFPPCTHLAVSGARWWPMKGPEALEDALELVSVARKVCESAKVGGFIENPVGRLTTYWRKPDYYFHPYEYGGYANGGGDGYTKKTGLWTFGRFIMPLKRPIELAADHDRIHRAAPGKDRAYFRSMTPCGFAQAVFEANTEPFRLEG